MLGSDMLEVAVGVSLVYLVLSLVCSTVREVVESLTKLRARHLHRGIRELLNDPPGSGLAADLYRHPLVFGLFAGDYQPTVTSNLPSYIPSRNFALALLDLVARGRNAAARDQAEGSSPRIALDTVRASIDRIENPPVQRALLVALDTAENDLARLQANVEAWFDSGMQRVSGWYKRHTQWILLAVAAVVAVAGNVDTLRLANHLARNDAVRQALVARAEAAAAGSGVTGSAAGTLLAEFAALDLPIGWPSASIDFSTVLGWIITAFAISLGAPFWFDLLSRLSTLRSTVKPQEKAKQPEA